MSLLHQAELGTSPERQGSQDHTEQPVLCGWLRLHLSQLLGGPVGLTNFVLPKPPALDQSLSAPHPDGYLSFSWSGPAWSAVVAMGRGCRCLPLSKGISMGDRASSSASACRSLSTVQLLFGAELMSRLCSLCHQALRHARDAPLHCWSRDCSQLSLCSIGHCAQERCTCLGAEEGCLEKGPRWQVLASQAEGYPASGRHAPL